MDRLLTVDDITDIHMNCNHPDQCLTHLTEAYDTLVRMAERLRKIAPDPADSIEKGMYISTRNIIESAIVKLRRTRGTYELQLKQKAGI